MERESEFGQHVFHSVVAKVFEQVCRAVNTFEKPSGQRQRARDTTASFCFFRVAAVFLPIDESAPLFMSSQQFLIDGANLTNCVAQRDHVFSI